MATTAKQWVRILGVTGAVTALGTLQACTPTTTIQTAPETAAKGADGQALPKPSFTNFPDIPVPGNAQMNLERTVVFGGGESWFGRIALSSNFAADRLFDFYKTELPRFGWEEITSVRSKTSVLTHQRGDRIATIQIEGGTLQGADVLVTVSPKGVPSQAPLSTK